MAKMRKRSKFFDTLAVTTVKVFPLIEGSAMGHLRGIASVILNDQLLVNGLRIRETDDGLSVEFPVDPFFRGKGNQYYHICGPLTEALSETVKKAVLDKYEEELKAKKEG